MTYVVLEPVRKPPGDVFHAIHVGEGRLCLKVRSCLMISECDGTTS